MEKRNWSQQIFRASLLLCAAFMSLTAFLLVSYHSKKTAIAEQSRRSAHRQAKRAVAPIDSSFKVVQVIVDSLVGDLRSGKLRETDLPEALKSTLETHGHLFQIGVAYKPSAVPDLYELLAKDSRYQAIDEGVPSRPYQYNLKDSLYALSFDRKRSHVAFSEIVYDYTLPDNTDSTRTLWYHQPLDEGKAAWIEPYFATGAQTLLAEYCAPFTRVDSSGVEQLVGVLFANYSLDEVRHQVVHLDSLGNTGYGFILAGDGILVSHPVRAYLGKSYTTIDDHTLKHIIENIVLRKPDQAASDQLLLGGVWSRIQQEGMEDSLHQEKIHIREYVDLEETYWEVMNQETGQVYWVFYEDIPTTKWKLGIVFNQSEMSDSADLLRRQLSMVVLSFLVGLFLLSALLLGAHSGGESNLWRTSISASLLCMVGIGHVWYLTVGAPTDEDNRNVTVVDRVSVEAALSKFWEGRQDHGSVAVPPVYVPTGVFVQSIEFSSANNVILTGYVWQKKVKDVQGDRTSLYGLIFPEAESLDLNKAYENEEVVGWYFTTTLRQQFDYSKYPFDREDVWIRLWPENFQENIVLIPDFGAYDIIRPDSRAGLERNFVLEGWKIQNSFFSYRTNSYNMNFGIEGYPRQRAFPELYFNVGLKRDFIDPFISDMIPIVIVAFLVFAVLMISTRQEEQIGLFGFSTSAVLGYCAALFFVLIVSHVHLRETLAARGIVYLEYYYFVMYAAVLVVSTDSILFASSVGPRFIHYKDNLVVKLLYWPTVLGVMLGITTYVFY